MIRSVKDIDGFSIRAGNEDIGAVKDFLFDDDKWAVRNLVVDTGTWLPGRRVLISPYSLKNVDWREGRILVALTPTQVKNSPEYDLSRPVSRDYETEYYGYYDYPPYWAGSALWGAAPIPRVGDATSIPRETKTEASSKPRRRTKGATTSERISRLRSAKEVIGYHIQAKDGEIGHIEDLLISDEDWSIHGVVVDTSNWPGGETLSISPYRISKFDWDEKKANIDMKRQEVMSSPEFHYSTARR